MLLAEDVLILLVKRVTSNVPRRGGTQAALAAAVLMELAVAGRLGVDRDGAGRLHAFVDDHTPFGDPLLDGALTAVYAVDGELVLDAVHAVVPGLYIRLLDRLTMRGMLTFRMGGWWVADRARREHLRHGLAGVLLGHSAPDWGSGALISVLHMLGATSVVVGGPVAGARATTIANGDWPADEVTRAIADDGAEIVLSWTSEGGGPTATVPTWGG